MRVRNWRKLQHFKDRRPPWIRLYRDLLDDRDWHRLDPSAAKALVMLWLLASEDKEKQGNLPPVEEIAFRLRLPESDTRRILSSLSGWLEQDETERYQVDIKLISKPRQLVASETETETETETEERQRVSVEPEAAAEPETETAPATATPPDPVQALSRQVLEAANEQYQLGWRKPHRYLTARLRAGATVDDCLAVIANRIEAWSQDPKMCEYVRQETLFREGKFEGYLQSAKSPPARSQLQPQQPDPSRNGSVGDYYCRAISPTGQRCMRKRGHMDGLGVSRVYGGDHFHGQERWRDEEGARV